MSIEPTKIANKVSVVTMIGNVLLSIFKFYAGVLSHSHAIISDAVHSASDVISTIAVMLGINVGNKKCDAEHQYGHEKIECLFALVVAMMLLFTGLGIGWRAIVRVPQGMNGTIPVPGKLAMVAAVVSIVVKEIMYWYTRAAAKKINSGAMLADAWHHRSDALSSIGCFIGIAGARMGFPFMDPLAALIICILIIKVSVDICKDAIKRLTDHSLPKELEESIRSLVLQVDGVLAIDKLSTRLFGSKFYVDIEISADGELPLFESHQIAEDVHDLVEKHFPDAKHCMVHVNPLSKKDDEYNKV